MFWLQNVARCVAQYSVCGMFTLQLQCSVLGCVWLQSVFGKLHCKVWLGDVSYQELMNRHGKKERLTSVPILCRITLQNAP